MAESTIGRKILSPQVGASLLEDQFSHGLASYFESNKGSWNSFRKSSMRALKKIDTLFAKGRVPLVSQDETDSPTGDYLELLTSTKQLFQNSDPKSINEEAIAAMMTLSVPFAGIIKDNVKLLSPDAVVRKYSKTLEKRRFKQAYDAAMSGTLSQLQQSAMWGFLSAELTTIAITILNSYVDLDRFPTIQGNLTMVPYWVGFSHMYLKAFKKAKKEYKGVMALPQLKFIVDDFSHPEKNGVAADLINDPVTSDAFFTGLEGAVEVKHSERKPDGLGVELYKIIKSADSGDQRTKSSSEVIDSIWNMKVNKEKSWIELDVAKKISYGSYRRLGEIQKSLSIVPLAPTENDHARFTLLKEEYQTELAKLIDLLDQSGYIQQAQPSENIYILEAVWNKAMSLKMTRRQFLTGGLIGFSIATLSSLVPFIFSKSEGDDSQLSEVAQSLDRRGIVPDTGPIKKIEQTEMVTLFDYTLKHNWPNLEKTDAEQVLQLVNTDGYSQHLQTHPYMYFSAHHDMVDGNPQELQKKYVQYLTDEYFPLMVYYAQNLKMDPKTLISGVVTSAVNIGDAKFQNTDVKLSKIQNMIGGLGWYLHRHWNVPFSELSKALIYDYLGPYDANRMTGQVTIGFNDTEISRIAEGLLLLPAPDLKRMIKNNPGLITVLESLTEDIQYESQLKSQLKKRVADYVNSYAVREPREDTSPIFNIISKNENWDLIGLGRMPDVLDIALQTTRFTRVWANMCRNHKRNIDSEKIVELSFEQTRNEFIEIMNTAGLEVAAEALIADQLENPRFREWWARTEDPHSSYRKKILATYEDLENTGNKIRKHTIEGYNAVAPLEYNDDFQLAQGLGSIHALSKTVKADPFLNTLCAEEPLWEPFLMLCIRDLAPMSLLTKESQYPLNVDYDSPYNPEDILNIMSGLITAVKLAYQKSTSGELIFKTIDIIDRVRNGADTPPDDFPDIYIWNSQVLPILKYLDINFYSSLYVASDRMNAIRRSLSG